MKDKKKDLEIIRYNPNISFGLDTNQINERIEKAVRANAVKSYLWEYAISPNTASASHITLRLG